MKIWRAIHLKNCLHILIFLILIFFHVGYSNVFEESDPYSPLISCELLPDEFVRCEELLFADHTTENSTRPFCPIKDEIDYSYSAVPHIPVLCHVVDDTIDCAGKRKFEKDLPCVKYTGYCFATVLFQSVFLGCLGVDRFCLGHTGSAVGKLLTIGGIGVWWFIDIILLVTGNLGPYDNSNWCLYY